MKRRVHPPRAKDRIDIEELERLERATDD